MEITVMTKNFNKLANTAEPIVVQAEFYSWSEPTHHCCSLLPFHKILVQEAQPHSVLEESKHILRQRKYRQERGYLWLLNHVVNFWLIMEGFATTASVCRDLKIKTLTLSPDFTINKRQVVKQEQIIL
jgi:hypothetical protein